MLKTHVASTAMVSEPQARPSSSSNLTEIAGYHLEQRIGVGGFGEVWRAIGPGGFAKAVKILFGNLTGPQAETELKSLNRIRDLRHPFLLNIERIEVVDGRVIVVSELADRSLDARFKEAVASGLKGIPRDELIGYLRDAADALDFMSEQHGLQHLDIKPENLLLQGSHGKVGDFGLTKNLSLTGHSLVNGFTPLYAPPELFDGKPDRASDQYSLAIVYQLMLTGVAPFNGRSAAQLTSQHLKSAPDLSSLHPSDRAVVARALSKNPRTRFPGCRQFVDELSKRRLSNSSMPRTSDSAETPKFGSLTEIVEVGTAALRKSQLLPPVTPLRPPAIVNASAWFVRPTVIIGLGGLGTSAAEMLRDRCVTQFPNATLPALQFVCIDSDVEATESVALRANAKKSAALQTVAIPLKSSHEYRKASGDHLNWLSRRWLFNIPRSGKVEGMRPLGRLAFVARQDEIRQQIQKALQSVFREESVKKMQEETGFPCSLDGIDVVLVGSTCGGTASGSLLDAASLVKSLIAEKRLPPTTVSAVLIHATSQGRQSADVQDANTISFLQELHYFSLPGVQRPNGGTRSGSTSAAGMPLDNAWLFHMGDDLSSVAFSAGLQSVAEYLELRTMTPARREMDAWRESETDSPADGAELQLRTFGIAHAASDAWDMASSEASQLCSALIQRWISQKSSLESFGSFSQLSPDLSTLINELALTSEGVIDLVPRLLSGERSKRVDEYASIICGRISQLTVSSDIPGLVADLIAQDAGSDQVNRNSISSVVDEIQKDLAAGMARSMFRIEKHLHNCLDGRGRLASAEQAALSLLKAIDTALATGHSQKSDLQQAFADLCASISARSPESSGPVTGNGLKAFCRQYCMLFVCQTVCQSVAAHMKMLRDSIAKLQAESILSLRRRLPQMSTMMKFPPADSVVIPDLLLNAFEESLLSDGRFQLSAFLLRDPEPGDVTFLTGHAANFLFRSVNAAATQRVAPTFASSGAFPASARPYLRNVGGGQRVLAAVPAQIASESWKTQLQEEFGQCVSAFRMNRTDISVLCEVEGIAISTVLDNLSYLKPKIVELAERVHSRHDIPW